MANMTNITVKDVNNADVVYTAVSPSSGDRNPAVWRRNDETNIMGLRPTFRVSVRNNGANTARVIEGSLRYPIFVDKDGIDTLLATVPLAFSGTLPTNVPVDWVTNAFWQFGNLIASALIRSSASEMIAPT